MAVTLLYPLISSCLTTACAGQPDGGGSPLSTRMRRKPSSDNRSRSTPVASRRANATETKRSTATLAGLRSEIDGVDKEITKRLNEIASRCVDLVTVMNRRAEI